MELVLVFNTTQKVYYTETKSTFKTFGTGNNATFAVEKENKSYTVDIEQKSKINQLLLSATPKGLLFSEWLKKNGYSDQLIKRYRESGWLEMLSKGVMYRTGGRNLFSRVATIILPGLSGCVWAPVSFMGQADTLCIHFPLPAKETAKKEKSFENP